MVSSGEYLCWLYFLRHMVYRDPGTGQVKQAGMSRGFDLVRRRLPASAGRLARVLRILLVCVVRHVKYFEFA